MGRAGHSKGTMMFILKLLSNRNFIFCLAVVLGLALGDAISWVRHLTIPALALVMTVSMVQMPLSALSFSTGTFKPILWTVLLNYILFGAITLLLAWFLAPNRALWYGFVIVAAAPPGVAIAPFVGILSGNEKYALIGVIGAYLASLLIIPGASLLFIGGDMISPVRILWILLQLIIGPLILSQLIIYFKMSHYVNQWRSKIVNWGLFVVIFTVIALNRDLLFRNPLILARAGIIAFIPIFGMGLLLLFLLPKTNIPRINRSSFMLFATVKNGGFAAATALSLFGENASLAGAVSSVFIILYLVFLTFQAKKLRNNDKSK